MDVKHEVARFENAVRRHKAAATDDSRMSRWASANVAHLAAATLHEHFAALGDRALTAEWDRRRYAWEQEAAATPPKVWPDAPHLKRADGEDD